MTIESYFSWTVCGLVVGLLARLLVPGRHSMDLLMTIVAGIAGALTGGVVYSLVRGNAVEPFNLVTQNWYGWIVATLGAMFLVWIHPRMYSRVTPAGSDDESFTPLSGGRIS